MTLARLMPFQPMLTHAVKGGLVGAALVDRDGTTIALAGAIADEEAMPLVALVMYRLKSADLAARLFAGEVLSLPLDRRDVAVGIARRQLFVVAVLGAATDAALARVRELRDDIADALRNEVAAPIGAPPWNGGAGGSGSGPAELPLIEYGVTVRRERGKA